MRNPDFVDKAYENEDFSNLNKLTLIIPTYNRNYYLSRCLWHHAHFPFGQIIVADSSPDEKKIVNRETVDKIRSLFDANILYLEYEPETDTYGGDIYRKWGDAIQHVNTPYSQISTDKEFILPEALSNHVDYLQNNTDYVACIGRREHVRIIGDNAKIMCYPHLSSITQQEPKTRYFKALQLPPWAYSHLHATMVSEIQKRTYTMLNKYNIADIRYGEIVVGYTSHIFGKTKYLPNIYRIRDLTHFIEGKKKNESSSNRYPFFDQYEREIGADYYNRYIRCLLTEFENQGMVVSASTLQNTIPESLIVKYNSSERSKSIAKASIFIDMFSKLPMSIQELLSKAIIKAMNICPLLGPKNPSGRSEVIVSKIISETLSDYDNDLPLSYIIR